MTKAKRTFEAETVTLSALRLENASQRTHKPSRKSRKRKNQMSAFITDELISKIIERIKAL